jgi:hypothetical protein
VSTEVANHCLARRREENAHYAPLETANIALRYLIKSFTVNLISIALPRSPQAPIAPSPASLHTPEPHELQPPTSEVAPPPPHSFSCAYTHLSNCSPLFVTCSESPIPAGPTPGKSCPKPSHPSAPTSAPRQWTTPTLPNPASPSPPTAKPTRTPPPPHPRPRP